jgi:hypothetical protein
MWHAWERRGIHTLFWCYKRKERDHLELVDTDERIILKCDKYIIWEGLDWIHVSHNRVYRLFQ